MAVLLALPKGETAGIVESDGVHVVLHSSVPSPPGSTLSGALTVDEATSQLESSPPLRIKVRGCRRTAEEPDRPFRIEGRFVDITRAQREVVVKP